MGRGTLAVLKGAVVVMGLMIVAGVVGLIVVVAGRLSGPARLAAVPAVLEEAPGTSLAGMAVAGDRLVLQLRGGGPDRVVIIDLRAGGAPLRIGLAR